MNRTLTLSVLAIILISCGKNTEPKELAKFDKNGNLMVYNQQVYAEMWAKNRNLKVTVVDTFCTNQKAKAIRDIKSGKLIYFGFHPREFKKMTEILGKYGIETKKHLSSCVRLGGFDPYCYQEEMDKEINRKYGINFIDSIYKIAQKEYILENPNIEYFSDGIDLREKYLKNRDNN